MTRFLVILLIGVSLVLLAGCAPYARMANMTPTNLSATSQHPYSVSTAVSGGEVTNPLWVSKISDEAFRGALEAAIRNSRVFSQVVSISGADYHLEVVITNLGQPYMGFNYSVTLTTHWKLTERGSPQPIFQDFISTMHTATVGDAFAAAYRLRLANEGAARKNIEEGIRRLSALRISPGGGAPLGGPLLGPKLKDYYSILWPKIKEKWQFSKNLPREMVGLEAIIVIVIGREGRVQEAWFEKKSGNDLYDDEAMRAIKSAEPFPPLPQELGNDTLKVGIRFYPE